MKGRTPTAEESRHMTWLVETFGCWCCSRMGIENRIEDVGIHHTEGKTKPGAHFKSIPLCDGHHSRYKPTGLHYNPTKWEEEWGKQEDIVAEIFEIKGYNPLEEAA